MANDLRRPTTPPAMIKIRRLAMKQQFNEKYGGLIDYDRQFLRSLSPAELEWMAAFLVEHYEGPGARERRGSRRHMESDYCSLTPKGKVESKYFAENADNYALSPEDAYVEMLDRTVQLLSEGPPPSPPPEYRVQRPARPSRRMKNE